MARFLFIIPFLLFAACTGPRYGDFFPYHEDGTLKPKVVFLPVKKSQSVEPEIACYFDESLRWLEMDRGYLFFYSGEEINEVLGRHPDWANEAPIKVADWFHPADFVASMEVTANDVVPLTRDLNSCFIPFPLSGTKQARLVKLKLSVVDLRGCQPVLILHETLEESQAIPVKQPCQDTPSIYESIARKALDRIEAVISCAR